MCVWLVLASKGMCKHGDTEQKHSFSKFPNRTSQAQQPAIERERARTPETQRSLITLAGDCEQMLSEQIVPTDVKSA